MHIKEKKKKQKMINAVLCVFSLFSYLRAQGVGEWTDPKQF